MEDVWVELLYKILELVYSCVNIYVPSNDEFKFEQDFSATDKFRTNNFRLEVCINSLKFYIYLVIG